MAKSPKRGGQFSQCQSCGSIVGSRSAHTESTGHKQFVALGGRQGNPSELLLMGANPMPRAREKNPYDQLSRKEKLAFGRLGLGKRQLQTAGDIEKARRQVGENERLRNRLPNPGAGTAEARHLPSTASAEAEKARHLYDEFTERPRPSESYTVRNEPHMPAGDYTDLGKLVALGVKPQPTGETAYVQEISFPGKTIRVLCDPDGRRLFLVGAGQDIEEEDLRLFGADSNTRAKVGTLRHIAYQATKWHPQLAESVRGAKREYEHQFGDEGGFPPELFYDRTMKRCLIHGGTYHVEGAGIVN